MYKQLTEGQRYQIQALLRNGFNQSAIARQLKVSASTVSRELHRNTGLRGYRPKQAHGRALNRRHGAQKHQKMTQEMEQTVIHYLQKDWSPEQINGHLKRLGGSWVSHETIYQFLLKDKNCGASLYKHLRQSRKKRKKRYGICEMKIQMV